MKKIAIIGLGYVGLPLAVEFGKYRNVVGYDLSATRIQELRQSFDNTGECSSEELSSADKLLFTNDPNELKSCEIYIICVPTPITDAKTPDLRPLFSASALVGSVLNKGNIVIYESTVFPGATEDECVPVLEENSGLVFNEDFFCGYSPERINPGDKINKLVSIKKVTSGSTPSVAEEINNLYKEIITAGTFLATSIKVAEAAKVIENTQRDVNIALINELSIIFNKMDIDTDDVLRAASTKWNFHAYKPGLVGGHCIGVDPYYLTHKALSLGYNPELILAGRRLNDSMHEYAAQQIIKKILGDVGSVGSNTRVLVLGLTFKENCSDMRNSKVPLLIEELCKYKLQVHCADPWITKDQIVLDNAFFHEDSIPNMDFDAIVLAVPHKEYVEAGIDNLKAKGRKGALFFDLKSFFAKSDSDWRL